MYPWLFMLLWDLAKAGYNKINNLSGWALCVLGVFWYTFVTLFCPDVFDWTPAICCFLIVVRIAFSVSASFRVLQEPLDFPDIKKQIKK